MKQNIIHFFLITTLNSSLLWFISNTSSSSSSAHALLLGNESDHLALLKFKDSISKDPFGVLDSWNTTNHFCKWQGITCNNSPKQQRVIELRLPGYYLHGSLSPQLSNLSFLRHIDLENNSFYGDIPQELGLLSHLQVLYLDNNSLTGEIPINLTSCSELTNFDFSWNNLIGNIPIGIGSLSKLKEFFIERNNLSGRIPPSIGNLTSLTSLVLISNDLEGNIPQQLCALQNLTYLLLDSNEFSSTLPSCLYNISSLSVLSVSNNNISGSLPANIFHNLPNLQFFQIGTNNFSGKIPLSVTNASLLQVLDLDRNHFVGQVPSLGKLTKLRFLSVSENNLGGFPTKDLKFLKPLANCSNLYVLGISVNNFGGQLPNYIGNLSTHLSNLFLGYNQIYGKIPAELGNLVNLTLLNMQGCRFDGNIPATFGQFQKMEVLELSGNKFSGEMPAFIGNLSKLFLLDLSDNMFEGSIPSSIGNCQNLQHLNFSKNNLSRTIPSEIFSISSLTILLDLSQNSFSGNLSDEVGKLQNLNFLKVSENNLVGNIPASIAECLSLEFLYLQGNSFSGAIPSSLVSLKGLRKLDISRNHLSGSIPEGLQNLSLEYLNISFNMLDGKVPTGGVFKNVSEFAMIGNNKLCGGVSELHLPPCPSEAKKPKRHHNFKLVVVIVCVCAFFFFLSLLLTICWMRKRSKKMSSDDSPTIDQLAKVSYQSLHNGTNGFSEENLIGSGSFGSVYKGTLELEESGVAVAIKVLKLQTKGAEKSFVAECNALKSVRHRNLVKILTCCSGTDYKGQEFKALVFEFMTNGSLESWLHPSTEIANQTAARSLNLEQRFNIINDVASAFHYLHYECDRAIIHRDLKPSNILLDDLMVAHVGDFGLARLLEKNIGDSSMQTTSTGLKGTFGYAPPEYGMGYQVSIEGDMYSFGILILEMLTGKRPTDEIFMDGHNLHKYVEVSISSNIFKIVDPCILSMGEQLQPGVENCLISLFKVGLACSMESPNERMTMVDLMRQLNRIKSCFPYTQLMEADQNIHKLV
ncbi:probable LRR receptor-like serine/threonine-protein kinase At3g47570 isoform X1 [Arachis duranensis]|uniref:non-specific serine/threonine protein kinase n=1 Tax=Arachis duranensis TaxID=130453 RepID=A0A6P4D675_ARADU|nr:probable LRR receptor-like serine/threonine-protein kinase At3g47570 isoform X1 [Arachis duranensis]